MSSTVGIAQDVVEKRLTPPPPPPLYCTVQYQSGCDEERVYQPLPLLRNLIRLAYTHGNCVQDVPEDGGKDMLREDTVDSPNSGHQIRQK